MNESILDEGMSSEEGKMSYKSKQMMKETAKWTLFISIVGFVFMGLISLAFIATSLLGFSSPLARFNLMGNFGLSFFFFILLLILILVPLIHLYNFSIKLKKAVLSANPTHFSQAFYYLKRHFTFIGTLYVIIIGIYLAAKFFNLMQTL